MKIGGMVATHHQFAYRTARLQYTKSMVQTALVVFNLVRETTLQSVVCVIEPLLRVTNAIEQLALQRAPATLNLALEIHDIRDNQFGGSAWGRCAQVCDEIDRRKYLVRRDELANGHCNFLSCAGSLYAHWVDQNLQPRRAPTEHIKHVADRCSAWRGHNPNPQRKLRQRPFP